MAQWSNHRAVFNPRAAHLEFEVQEVVHDDVLRRLPLAPLH
jgi:hypothetical protein